MRKYWGSIVYENAKGVHELDVDMVGLDEFEEMYGRVVDSGDDLISVNLHVVFIGKED